MKPAKSRRIVLATDLSARCDRAFDRAVLLARQWPARLTIVNALESCREESSPRRAPIDRQKVDAECQISSDLHRAGISAEVIVRRGSASDIILEAAQDASCDLIVAGIARNLGLTRAFLGGTLESLMRQSVAPVLVVKRPAREPYRSAVVGTNLTRASRAAIQATRTLFRPAEMTVLHAYRPLLGGFWGVMVTDDVAYQHALEECTTFVAGCISGEKPGLRCVAEIGQPGPALNRYAVDRHVDLIAIGMEPRNLVGAALSDNVSSSLILRASTDLLVVPPNRGFRESARTFDRPVQSPKARMTVPG